MTRRRPEILIISLIIAGCLSLVFLTWANYRYSVQNPGGSDLLPRWVGTRLFLMEGKSPYSDEVTGEIHRLFYGRPARSNEDQVLFVYPLYSIFVFGPFSLVADFNMARALWMTVLEVAVVLLVAVSLSLARWRISPLMLGLLLLFSVLWYHSLRPLINANASILLSLLIALAFLAIRAGRDGVAGALLALSTIKPQMVFLLIAFVLLWSISRQRWVLFWSILGNLVLMVAVTSLLLPDWVWQNVVQIVAYPNYTAPTSPGEIFAAWMPGVGSQMGRALTVVMLVMLIVEWQAAWGKEPRWMLWTALLTLTATQLVGVPTATENYIVLLPALVLVFAAWDEQWGALGRSLVYISLAGLFFGLWALFLATLGQGDQPAQGLIMFFPLPLFLLTTLYWVRWWVLRPEQPVLDRLRYLRRR
ncbi:MAG: glycosyltransferase 87 family protein [Chloroflexota bacterium]